jgi:hypothetical protein
MTEMAALSGSQRTQSRFTEHKELWYVCFHDIKASAACKLYLLLGRHQAAPYMPHSAGTAALAR